MNGWMDNGLDKEEFLNPHRKFSFELLISASFSAEFLYLLLFIFIINIIIIIVIIIFLPKILLKAVDD